MKAYAVIGSGYGDEGKGLFTDYITHSLRSNPTHVVRYNGGAQAGHTVTTPQGERHVFGHIASGAFNQHSHTFLSEYFVVNLLLLKKELSQFSLKPHITINEKAYLTTPFDMLINQLLEAKRALARHGSCGLGFGETIERCEQAAFKTTIKDIDDPHFYEKLIFIQENYVKPRIKALGLNSHEFAFMFEASFLNKFVQEMRLVRQTLTITQNTLPLSLEKSADLTHKNNQNEQIIFEGAQGLLLDQNFGVFPYVTRSNTGLKNIISLIENTQITSLEVVYASRCYTTRHGAGPLNQELSQKPYENIVDKTNFTNEFQGSLRFSYLDLDVLEKTIKLDQSSVKTNIKINYLIGLSCLDQTHKIHFYEHGELKTMNNIDFPQYVSKKFGYCVLASYGPTRDTIKLLA